MNNHKNAVWNYTETQCLQWNLYWQGSIGKRDDESNGSWNRKGSSTSIWCCVHSIIVFLRPRFLRDQLGKTMLTYLYEEF